MPVWELEPGCERPIPKGELHVLMATAAKDGRVTLLKVGSQKLYRALPQEDA